MTQTITIYTDGACRGNPGPGGWGVVLRAGTHTKELYGYAPATTNNRMELTAATEALRAVRAAAEVHLYTDSTYVKNGIEQWLVRWQRNQWRTAAKKPVKNRELWESLAAETARHQVHWHWVKGHSGAAGNERADALANYAIDHGG